MADGIPLRIFRVRYELGRPKRGIFGVLVELFLGLDESERSIILRRPVSIDSSL